MTPKEKAKELVDRMLNSQGHTCELYDAKLCTLIAVDEISKVVNDIWMDSFTAGESDNKLKKKYKNYNYGTVRI